MFSLIIPSRPCLTDLQTISPNQFAFTFPSTPHFSHIVVFILPGNVLPEGTAAAVYLQLPGDTSFRFLGAIANEKPSAIFKVNLSSSSSPNLNNGDGDGDNDMMTTNTNANANANTNTNANVSLGISVEPISNIQPQLLQLQQSQQSQQQLQQQKPTHPPPTKILAQRIIKNAFNFLASFSGNVPSGGGNNTNNTNSGSVEVVPLKSFEEWWKKFERRVENDPTFLERDVD